MKAPWVLPALFVTYSTALSSSVLLLLLQENIGGARGTCSPVTANDVIGRVKNLNREQCRRLCWYRALCTDYSHCSSCGWDHISCLLHSSHVEAADDDLGGTCPVYNHPDWTKEAASGADLNHDCAVRRCGPSEICVPAWAAGTDGGYRCLSAPARCGVQNTSSSSPLAPPPPPPVAGTRLQGEGGERWEGQQGQVRMVKCLPDHELVLPPYANASVQCQVNSKWTKFKGRCVQVNFTKPETPLTADLPWSPVAEKWGLCVQGVYTKNNTRCQSLLIRCDPNPNNESCKTIFSLIVRLWNTDSPGILWKGPGNSKQTNFLLNESLPFQAGDTFTHGLLFLPSGIRVDIHGRVNSTTHNIPLGHDINLTKVTRVKMKGAINLTFVNILEHC